MQGILGVIYDVIIDMLKIIPFLFITYLVMEYIEHRISDKSKKAIQKLLPKYGQATWQV